MRILPLAKSAGCPTEQTLDLISGRWKAMVIYWLLPGTRRSFGSVPGDRQIALDLSGERISILQCSFLINSSTWDDICRFTFCWNISCHIGWMNP